MFQAALTVLLRESTNFSSFNSMIIQGKNKDIWDNYEKFLTGWLQRNNLPGILPTGKGCCLCYGAGRIVSAVVFTFLDHMGDVVRERSFDHLDIRFTEKLLRTRRPEMVSNGTASY